MLPTIPEKAFLVCSRLTANLHVGQIVCVKIECNGATEELLKRIARIDENGIYLLGDNPAQSYDSRYFGYVSRDSVIGIVLNY